MPETPEAAFERGARAAVQDEHGVRLDRLNGSIARHAAAIEALVLAVQKLVSAHDAILARMASAAELVKTTADALAAAELARVTAETAARARADWRWTPLLRASAVVGLVLAVLGGVAAIRALIG